MNTVDRAREIVDLEIAALKKVRDGLGAGFARAIDLILERLNQGGKVVLTGLGKNLHVGQKIAATLTSTGTPALMLHPSDAMHGDLGLLQRPDVLLVLSYSGETDELIQLLPLVRRSGVTIIALTGETESTLATHSDAVVPVTIDREACPFNMAPTASTTATLAVGDALAIVLLEARGFKREDYAKLHPGGTIGRTLLLRVADIMRTGERLARVHSGARVRDAVLAMTSARSGAVAVTDADDRVVGVFTDGDLRRHLGASADIAGRSIDEVMTSRPIAIRKDQLAMDVLKLFERHAIDDLVVVDEQDRLVGMVDIQDLPRLKLL